MPRGSAVLPSPPIKYRQPGPAIARGLVAGEGGAVRGPPASPVPLAVAHAGPAATAWGRHRGARHPGPGLLVQHVDAILEGVSIRGVAGLAAEEIELAVD